ELPAYMVPSWFVTVDSLPYNTSGKVARMLLPDPLEAREALIDDYEPPKTSTEIVLAEIWSAVLNVKTIGRNDSFFDIGGDSLSIVRVLAQVQLRFSVEVNLEDVNRSPYLKDFAALIDAAEAADFPAPQAGQENTRYGCRLGHGPVVFPVHRKVISDPVLFELFLQTAEKENIPYQVGQANMAETRVEAAGAINKVKAEMRSLTLSTPVRYAHTAINRAHLGDVENTLRLLKAGLAGLTGL
ncbi:MAG: phosphopantetheine-binding protein, partial [Anaerolineaceae bacterium]